MNPATLETTNPAFGRETQHSETLRPTPRWQKFPCVPMALTLAFLAFMLFPPVRENPRLVWTFTGLAAALLVWELILWAVARRSGRLFRIEFVPVKSHYVQACVQFCIMLYWGWYWRNVYAELPLIASQLVYLYILDALLSWSRGRVWRLGFGPMPIVISTNLLLWFKHDYFVFQFLMLTTGALAKQFITWNRDGKRTHIFNPSAFGQALFAVVLIATATTREYTWGKEIAQTFDVPHMLVVIFLGGLVVQYFFQVTLMTFSAVATLCLFELIYAKITGVYFLININVAAPIFLGMHLLITDPATSPRTNVGKVMFGSLYALGYCALFRILDLYEVPLFWDKLLPVPLLNLCVPLIDRFTRSGIVGRVNQLWESALPPRKLNLVHMGCWIALFSTMWFTGFIDGQHPGNSIPFWKQAYAEGKPHAGHSLIIAAGAQAEDGGSGAAFNELALICMEGKIIKENHGNAALYFAKACELNDECGCVNVMIQFLFLRERRSEEDVALALDRLETDCRVGGSGRSCYLAGFAYETGRGRPQNNDRAIELYEQCGLENLYACKGLARIVLSGANPTFDIRLMVQTLAQAAKNGDAESCWYLAFMYHDGIGFRQNDEKAREVLQRACDAGSEQACAALKTPELPPYSNPVMMVPGWCTAFPMP